jgi:hypothetical protein
VLHYLHLLVNLSLTVLEPVKRAPFDRTLSHETAPSRPRTVLGAFRPAASAARMDILT